MHPKNDPLPSGTPPGTRSFPAPELEPTQRRGRFPAPSPAPNPRRARRAMPKAWQLLPGARGAARGGGGMELTAPGSSRAWRGAVTGVWLSSASEQGRRRRRRSLLSGVDDRRVFASNNRSLFFFFFSPLKIRKDSRERISLPFCPHKLAKPQAVNLSPSPGRNRLFRSPWY